VPYPGTSAAARDYQSELLGVGLRSQAGVDATTTQQQNLFERSSKLAVEPSVDDGVEEAVGVPEPEEQSFEPVWDTLLRVLAEWPYEGQYEEREPAGGKSSHDNAKCSRCFALFNVERRSGRS